MSTARPGLIGGLRRADRVLAPWGNDANDGTAGAPWRTLAKAADWLLNLPTSANVTLLIRRGEYTQTDSGLWINYLSTPGITVTVVFEPGCTVTTSQLGGGGGNGIGAVNNVNATFHLNGARFFGTNQSSANGIGVHGVARVTVFGGGAVFDGYDDGWSNHDTSYAEVYDCTFQNCTKGALTHVHSSTFYAARCVFIGRSGASLGVGGSMNSSRGTLEDCAIIPAVEQNFGIVNGSTLRRCIIGTPSIAVQWWLVPLDASTYEDCYLHVWSPSLNGCTFRRCFGRISVLARGNTSVRARIENCVFNGPATGRDYFMQTGSTFSVNNFDPACCDVVNSIFRGYTKFIDLTANNGNVQGAVDALNAQWTMQGVCLHNVTTQRNPVGINLPSPLITSDPLLVDPTSTHQAGYLTANNSPARGAGLAGANIGLPV